MALYAEVQVGRKKHTQEKLMPQSDNQAEVIPPVTDNTDERFANVMAQISSGVEVGRLEPADAAQAVAAREEPSGDDASLVSVMAQGREHLMQRMREHYAQAEARKNAYKPPPMTARQRSVLEEEQAAGRRARERHETELANRPPPPPDPSDGTNTPVHRPGNVVPDPTVPAVSGFAAGRGQLDAEGTNTVVIPGQ